MHNIIFMGTPDFAVPTLQLLCKKNKKPVLCVTQPDKSKGRNRKIQPSEVKECALSLEIPIYQPEDVNSEEAIEFLRKIKPDIIITVAYGSFLKKHIREIPVYGCINLHPSLLPKYRGSAPINYALFQGDSITGCTIFQLTSKMDAGPILHQSEMLIRDNECYTELAERLAVQGALDIMKTLDLMDNNLISSQKQEHDKATYSRKLEKKDFFIQWNTKALDLQNRVRGLAEKPGLTASFRNKTVKIISIELTQEKSIFDCGTIVSVEKSKGIIISTNDFNVLITKVQPMGKSIMSAYAFHLGAQIQSGEKFTDGV
jgi:methionyl-tRNA formyltransferase